MFTVAKKIIDEQLKELKNKIQAGKVIIGTERVTKLLRSGGLVKIFLSNNCPEEVKKDINYYAGLSSVPIVELDFDNEELGVFCKKNFFVSMVGVSSD